MRIGTRITITTSALVALSLGTYGLIALRSRRSDVREQGERQTRELGEMLRASLEVALENGGLDEVRRIGALLTKSARAPFEAETVVSTPVAGADPGFAERLRVMLIRSDVVVDRKAKTRSGRDAIAVLLPIHDRNGQIVAAIEVRRDEASLEAELDDATLSTLITIALLTAAIALVVALVTGRGVTQPITKLIDGIDGVARGDLSRVVLQEREDEIGALAERFNEMTGSLREAREETRRGSEAKLELEERLRHAEKLATIGQLAAGIAHEVGTPLNVIAGRASVMARKAPDEAEVRKNAGIIADQAERITRIIQQLLDFARKRPSARDLVDIGKLAAGSLDFLEHKFSQAGISARIEIEPGIPPIPGDPDQVQQICLNLYLNAIQAMPAGGKLTVRIARAHRKKPGLERAAASGWIVIEVADNGVGIAEADRDKIFEPFYSTKAHGEGTGLGLSVSHGIVRDHDGWIEVDPGAERGTVFRVFLPSEPPPVRSTTLPPVQMSSSTPPEGAVVVTESGTATLATPSPEAVPADAEDEVRKLNAG